MRTLFKLIICNNVSANKYRPIVLQLQTETKKT
jgi:hypothetical protein